MHIVYFSNYSGNTKRFVEKLDAEATQIPIKGETPVATSPYVLFVPTYGGGSETQTVPRQVVAFLNISENRELLVGIVGMGNTNFGSHYCKAATIISEKTGKPVLDKVEIFGTPEDVARVQKMLQTVEQNELTKLG